MTRLVSRFARLMLGVMILALLALALPQPVSAAYPSFDIIAIQAGQSVTIRTQDFPANVTFLVRMDVFGNRAENGIAVAYLNSGRGGVFEATIMIPAALKDTGTIAIRLESTEGGYFAYDYFTNRTTAGTPNPQPIPVTSGKPYLTFLGVKANESVTVEARNLPANTTFTVRVGPYQSFFRDYVTAPSIQSDGTGYARFDIALPSVVRNVELVTVRIDGSGRYAFNAFKNVTGGSSIPVTSTGTCQVTEVTPASTVRPGADLDVVWTVKNNSNRTWEAASVDYAYVSGAKFQANGDRYDMRQTVKPGETVKIIVDALAPNSTGNYTTNWALMEGSSTLCSLSYTLRVR